MMRTTLFSVLLVGCAATTTTTLQELPVPVEIETVKIEEAPATPAVREVVKARKPAAKAPDKVPPVPKLPPCESVPGDKRSAILQKLDCVIETGDIPVKPNP